MRLAQDHVQWGTLILAMLNHQIILSENLYLILINTESNIIRVVKSKRVRWAGHVVCMVKAKVVPLLQLSTIP
jgi:hypothetical protein